MLDMPGLRTLALTSFLAAAATSVALAQGVTTGTIAGTVSVPLGQADDARVRIVNRSTGYAIESQVRRGRFFASGLETGGPYLVEVRRLGMMAHSRDVGLLRAGEKLEIDVALQPVAATLDTVRVEADAERSLTRSRVAGGGTAATISDGVLRNMPALNRDLLDFARLVPEIGTRFGGVSGGGVGYRFNSYLVDGATERLLNGNGMMSGAAGGKPISIEAVKEYQVLLAPYDPRYGDFAGALINAVTKSGTNQLHGGAFAYGRNDGLTRNTEFLRDAPYDRAQMGFSVGGPIVRDRAHFFFASEFQRLNQPSTGPYVGSASARLPASPADIQRFETLLRGYGLEPGNGDRVNRPNPTSNVFARLDVALPWRSRMVLRHNVADAWQTVFSRPAGTPRFALTSNQYTLRAQRWSSVLQLFTQLSGGWSNELLVNRAVSPGRATSYARSPLIEVGVPARPDYPAATLFTGSPDNAQGTGNDQKTFEIADHLTYNRGAHTLAAGARAELFAYNNVSTRGQFGIWRFGNLDSLELGAANSFRVEKDFGSATAVLRGSQVSLYLGDSWKAMDRLTLNGGVRAEVLTFRSRPPYNRVVDSVYKRRTDDFPGTQVQWSPRLGFVVDLANDSRLRGGAGVFAGRPPLAWVTQPLRFDGIGTRSLICEGANIAPPFVANPASMPSSCRNGDGFRDGLVNLIASDLRMAEMFRSSLAYERGLPWGIAGAIEAMYTRTLSDFVFVNPNLKPPVGTDPHGRVMYGSHLANGVSSPSYIDSTFFQMIDVRNHGNGHALSFTARLEKRFLERLETTVSYTRSRVRDVQSVTNAVPALTYAFWANSRALSGRHEELTTGVSAYEIPHRILVATGWTTRARRWPTSVSLYYVGEAGVPFTFTDSTPVGRGRGDLNADGSNSNDPIYVPRDVMDPAEITFQGQPDVVWQQRHAFESFIARTPCLRRQRGRILARNSCSGPWVHSANAALRQQLPARWSREHALSLDVEVFNVLNLLNPRWGLVRVPNTVALTHERQNAPAAPAEPVFKFDPARRASESGSVESAYQIQLALRYRF